VVLYYVFPFFQCSFTATSHANKLELSSFICYTEATRETLCRLEEHCTAPKPKNYKKKHEN